MQTYNLTVDGWHTYFVAGSAEAGSAGVWVHNTQQKSCGFNLQKSLAEWNANKNMGRFRAGGDLEKLKPHQKFLLAADRNQVRRPGLDRVDLSSVKPEGYNLDTEDIWQGSVSFELKGSGKRVAYKNGFPDFTPYKYKAGPGRSSEVSITPGQSREVDFDAAWGAGRFSQAERSALEKSHVWHHATDIANGKVKMQLVEKDVHNLSRTTLGYNHTGGFAIVKWLRENNIPF